jgi:hypothetical protein
MKNTSGYVVYITNKESVQPQVPLRLPCYDFTPVVICGLGPYSYQDIGV